MGAAGRGIARWLVLALAIDAVLVVADLAVGRLAVTYLIVPVLLAGFTTPLLTSIGAVSSVALAALSGVWNDNVGEADFFIRVGIVVLGGGLAVYAAGRRARAELAERQAQSLAAVGEVVEVSPVAVIGMDESGLVTMFNPTAEAMFGYRSEDAVGRELAELVVPPPLRDAHRAGLERYRETGESRILGRRLDLTAQRADGCEFPVELTITRLGGGGPAAFAGFIRDVTEEKRTERAQRVLGQTAELLASSVDYDQTLREVTQLAVPEVADWCAVDMPARDGRIATVSVAHADPEKGALGRSLRARYKLEPDADHPLARVIREGTSYIDPEMSDDAMSAYAGDAEHLEGLREIGFCSLMIVPLKAGRRTIGALSFGAGKSGRSFDEADLELAEELARRAGSALDNARLYQERSDIASTLMASLQPGALPDLPGWRMAALYQPAGRTDEVGGDFYDVFPAGDGWMLVIGDIVGHGPTAAALTSLARYSIRTAATLTGSPGAALGHLNRELRREGRLALLSAACVHLCETDGDARATIAVAGHPRPILLHDGQPRPVGETSLVLGVSDDAEFVEETIELDDNDTVVLYTDGVIDAAGETERFGEDRLMDSVAGEAPSPEGLIERLSRALESFQRRAQRDDIAVLAVQRRSPVVLPGEPVGRAVGTPG